MSNFNGGRLGIQPFYNPDDVQNPFRGVFTEGARQTAIDIGEGITESRMRDEGLRGERQWVTPVAGVEGGALAQSFGEYKMTPDSPSVSESQHWDYYQPEMDPESEHAPPPVDPTQDPGGALAASTAVRAYQGGGSGAVKPRPVPKMGATVQEAQDEQGKQVMFDQNKIPAWHESSAFGHGLISFGLNLLSGNDLATSFNQAGNRFNDAFGREKREAWRQDLVDQGFDAHEIEKYIETGDNKALSDPMQKKMQQQQYKLGQMNLQKAMFENSPEMLEYKAQKEQRGEEREEERLAISKQSANASAEAARIAQSLAERKFKYQQNKDQAAADAKADAYKNPESRDVVLGALQAGTNLGLANTRLDTVGGGIAKVLGESPLGGHLIDEGMLGESAQSNKKVLSERRNFVQGPLRMATGAAYGPSEIDDYTTALFPTGADFDKPDIMRRKQFMQDAVMSVANGMASGYRSKRLDMSNLKKSADDVSSGVARPIRSKSSGLIVGVAYQDGSFVEF